MTTELQEQNSIEKSTRQSRNSELFKFDNWLKIIPGLIIFYSLIYNYEYCRVFNIDAVKIYSIEELLLGFLPIIRPMFALVLMSLIIPIMIYLQSDYFNISKHRRRLQAAWRLLWMKKGRNRFKRLFKLISLTVSLPAVVFLLTRELLLWLIQKFVDDSIERLFLSFFAEILIVICVYQFIIMFKQFNVKLKLIPAPSVVFCVVILLGVKFFGSMGRTLATYDENIDTQYSFIYKGEFYITNDNLIVVADTKQFIVFYDKCEKQSMPFNKNDLSHIKIKYLR